MTNYQIYRHSNNITNIIPVDHEYENQTSLTHYVNASDPEVYQIGRFVLKKSDSEFLYNQVRNALCANDDNMAINISFINTSGELINHTIKLSDTIVSSSRNISVVFQNLEDLDNPLNTNGNYINLGAIQVNMFNDITLGAVPSGNNSGHYGYNIDCVLKKDFAINKRVGLLEYKIKDSSIEITLDNFLNEILNKENKYGTIDIVGQNSDLDNLGVVYISTGSNGIYHNNTISKLINLDNNKKIIVSHYNINDLCKLTSFEFSDYNKYLLTKCKAITRYSQIDNKAARINYIVGNTTFNYRFDRYVLGSTTESHFTYNSYVEHKENSNQDFSGNTVTNNLIYYDLVTNGVFNYTSNCMEDLINNSTAISNYKYRNALIDKISKPFTNDKLINKAASSPAPSGEYESAVISTNFFIADQPNCIYPSDYLILDIEELNNKYSNNNNIEKHAFVEIPNNTGALIYYESTNLGYSTKEFNPPIRKLNRLTIKVRDSEGNILPNEDTSKDYTLIMNVQEINNSSSTSIINN